MRVYLPLLFLFFSSLLSPAQAQDTVQWKGFEQLQFKLGEQAATLVIPKEALTGKPWMWRARFPNWHTEADSILAAAGYHIAYINTNNLYGSPKAMAIWDQFYQHLIKEYDLHPKVALNGVSRGGLFVYNWAKQNPEKVSWIYAEAPVCDFKSWPAGWGKGLGSPNDWEKLKEAYGFSSDEEAKQYDGNPLEGLTALAKEKVPILHMIGLADEHVPAAENTFLLVDNYIKLGGIATVVPCTEGEQSLKGHHFPIETPQLVADFVSYHATPAGELDPSRYHSPRKGLKNAQYVFEQKKKARVGFLGGSITYNPGWRDSVSLYLQRRFPETQFEFVAAGIPSMGSTPGAFRLERDVLSAGKIDLLFEEAAVNDETNGRTDAEQLRGMEGIVRHMRAANPAVDIVLMHFVDPDKMEVYNSGDVPAVINNHEQVARHYEISTINLAKEVTERINNKEFSWENDFKNLHPSPFGQVVYAKSMIHFLEKAFAGPTKAIENHALPTALDPASYDDGYLVEAAQLKAPKGWEVKSNWKPVDRTGTRPNYTDVPMLIGKQGSSILSFSFEGSAVGIAVAAGLDAGMIDYQVDKGEWQRLNLFTKWSKSLHLPWYYTLAAGLAEGKHKLKIRVVADRDERSIGQACRIRYFYVNR